MLDFGIVLILVSLCLNLPFVLHAGLREDLKHIQQVEKRTETLTAYIFMLCICYFDCANCKQTF